MKRIITVASLLVSTQAFGQAPNYVLPPVAPIQRDYYHEQAVQGVQQQMRDAEQMRQLRSIYDSEPAYAVAPVNPW